jgi:hypothetical protein
MAKRLALLALGAGLALLATGQGVAAERSAAGLLPHLVPLDDRTLGAITGRGVSGSPADVESARVILWDEGPRPRGAVSVNTSSGAGGRQESTLTVGPR